MIFDRIRKRWKGEAGHGEVFAVAIPLILTTSFHTVQNFVDRMFLAWYTPDALAASLAAGMTFFTLASVFFGTLGYVNTFVAQYVGAGRPERVGATLWQGVYLSLASAVLLFGLSVVADPLFRWIGHAESVRALEIDYFRILAFGSGFGLIMGVASCFYTGRGKTWTILWVNCGATVVNIVLDYAWIFGNWGFPEWGISGAAWATVASQAAGATVLCLLVAGRKNRVAFSTLRSWRIEWNLIRRLIRFGTPAGLQGFIEMMGYTGVILLIGRVGSVELAASSAAFNINTLAFLPPIGLSIAVTTLVGQRLGQNRPDLAERATWSGYHIVLAYMLFIGALYVLIPKVFLYPLERNADPETFKEVSRLTIVLLRFVALYSIFDTMGITFGSALRGAGDTRFVMWTSTVMCVTVMIVPAYLVTEVFHGGVYALWWTITIYIALVGSIFLLRFRGGKWKAMRVIEAAPVLPDLFAATESEADGERSTEAP